MDETTPCPWCGTPTRRNRPATRGLVLAGKEVGELCPSCADESRGYDAEADADRVGIAADPPSSW